MITPLIALVFGAIGLGRGIYETLIVDRVWPDNLAIIQPQRGGLDRKARGLVADQMQRQSFPGWIAEQ